jgi:hypothetical protein
MFLLGIVRLTGLLCVQGKPIIRNDVIDHYFDESSSRRSQPREWDQAFSMAPKGSLCLAANWRIKTGFIPDVHLRNSTDLDIRDASCLAQK